MSSRHCAEAETLAYSTLEANEAVNLHDALAEVPDKFLY